MATKRTNGHRNIEAFPLDTGLSKPQRAAAFLDWWATKHPYDFAAYNEILKAIEGYNKLPRMDTEEVEAVRAADAYVARIDAIDGSLRSVVEVNPDALAIAEGTTPRQREVRAPLDNAPDNADPLHGQINERQYAHLRLLARADTEDREDDDR